MDNKLLINEILNSEVNPYSYCEMFSSIINIMKTMLAAQAMKITAVVNHLPYFLLPYPQLFRFAYCDYLISMGFLPEKMKFSRIEIPPSVEKLYEKAVACAQRLDNVTCIFDDKLLSGMITKIKYYHAEKNLSGREVELLQTELFKLMLKLEELFNAGKNNAGKNYSFYFSFLNIDSNIVLIEYDDNAKFQNWIYPSIPLVISNGDRINDIQNRRIKSILQSAMPITQISNPLKSEMLSEMYLGVEEMVDGA